MTTAVRQSTATGGPTSGQALFCVACAAPNVRSDRVCARCGQPLATPHRAGASPRLRLSWAPRLALLSGPLLALAVAVGWAIRLAWLEPAAASRQAERYLAAGRIPEALSAYAAAGGFAGAAERGARLRARFEPFADELSRAEEALAAGDPAAARARLEPIVRVLPRYETARALLATAREAHRTVLLAEAERAARAEDWLAAEAAWAALAALDPADPATRDQLRTVTRRAPVLFARERELWLAGPDGSDARPVPVDLPAAWPTWSPDRKRIAFTSIEEGSGRIALYVVDRGGGQPRLVATGLRPYGAPVWSPDGRRLAFASTGGGQELIGQTEPDRPDIEVVDVETGRRRRLTGGQIENPQYPTWSPDGTRIALVSRAPDASLGFESPPVGDRRLPAAGEVYLVTLTTGAIENLSAGRIDHPWRVAWSPRGERILVYTRAPGMSYDRDHVRLALIDVGTGEISDLPTGGARITMPVWSPDGTRVAYAAGEADVVVQSVDGERASFPLPGPISRFLSWNPDGSALLAAGEGSAPSFVLPLDEAATSPPTPIAIDYDLDRRQSGAPTWGSGVALAPVDDGSAGGTALDAP